MMGKNVSSEYLLGRITQEYERIWNPVYATVNLWKIQRELNAWNHPVVFIGMALLV